MEECRGTGEGIKDIEETSSDESEDRFDIEESRQRMSQARGKGPEEEVRGVDGKRMCYATDVQADVCRRDQTTRMEGYRRQKEGMASKGNQSDSRKRWEESDGEVQSDDSFEEKMEHDNHQLASWSNPVLAAISAEQRDGPMDARGRAVPVGRVDRSGPIYSAAEKAKSFGGLRHLQSYHAGEAWYREWADNGYEASPSMRWTWEEAERNHTLEERLKRVAKDEEDRIAGEKVIPATRDGCEIFWLFVVYMWWFLGIVATSTTKRIASRR
jgi:hypothetical protein